MDWGMGKTTQTVCIIYCMPLAQLFTHISFIEIVLLEIHINLFLVRSGFRVVLFKYYTIYKHIRNVEEIGLDRMVK